MYKGEYQLIGSEMSFFSRKLEAQLRFQNIPWRWQFKTEAHKAELEARAGTHFIPLLATPDKWLINDTIAIGPMLNARFSQRPVIPESPLQRACCFILEDAFNHWLGLVLEYLRATYFQFVSASIAAGLGGKKYYEYDYGYGPTRAHTQKRLNVARLHVEDELLHLGANKNTEIQRLFAGRGILEHYIT